MGSTKILTLLMCLILLPLTIPYNYCSRSFCEYMVWSSCLRFFACGDRQRLRKRRTASFSVFFHAKMASAMVTLRQSFRFPSSEAMRTTIAPRVSSAWALKVRP